MIFGKKTEKILETETGFDAINLINNILSPVFYKNPEKLTLCERNIIYIIGLEGEVNNGGFSQYFFNSSGDFSKETLDALNAVGSKIFFGLLQKAINQFPNGTVPKNRDERQKVLEEIEENNEELWTELDDEFFKCEEDLDALLIEYIKSNIKDFR